MTKYGHAILMAISGILILSYSSVLLSFLGVLLIGYGLKLAYEAGQESK
jgi:hypothetical protein